MQKMMKRYFLPLFAVMTIASVASCSKQIETPDNSEQTDLTKMTFSATMGEGVELKTTYAGRNVFWEATDEITVFSVGESVTKTSFGEPELLENGAFARFSGLADATASTYYAVYPHSEGNTYADGTFSVTFPSTHTAVANGFPSGSNVSVAVSQKDADATEQTVQFKNAGALLAFSFKELETALNTASVTFKVKKSDTEYYGISGSTTITLDENNLPVAAEGNEQEVVVNAPVGGFNTGVNYFIPVIPVGSFTGMEVIFTDLNGDEYVKKNDTDSELLRSYMFNVGQLPNPYNVDFPENFTVSLDFKAGWPFMEPCLEAAKQNSTNGDTYRYIYTYDLPNGKTWVKDIVFVLYSTKDYPYSHTTSKGLTAGKKVNGLKILIPGLSGRYFESLAFTSPDGFAGQWNLALKVTSDGASQISGAVDGSPKYTWTFPFTNQADDLVEVGMGASCAMFVRRSSPGRLYTLEIKYTTIKPGATE